MYVMPISTLCAVLSLAATPSKLLDPEFEEYSTFESRVIYSQSTLGKIQTHIAQVILEDIVSGASDNGPAWGWQVMQLGSFQTTTSVTGPKAKYQNASLYQGESYTHWVIVESDFHGESFGNLSRLWEKQSISEDDDSILLPPPGQL